MGPLHGPGSTANVYLYTTALHDIGMHAYMYAIMFIELQLMREGANTIFWIRQSQLAHIAGKEKACMHVL